MSVEAAFSRRVGRFGRLTGSRLDDRSLSRKPAAAPETCYHRDSSLKRPRTSVVSEAQPAANYHAANTACSASRRSGGALGARRTCIKPETGQGPVSRKDERGACEYGVDGAPGGEDRPAGSCRAYLAPGPLTFSIGRQICARYTLSRTRSEPRPLSRSIARSCSASFLSGKRSACCPATRWD